MKYNFKKIITVFISCALLITFAGCGESWERTKKIGIPIIMVVLKEVFQFTAMMAIF